MTVYLPSGCRRYRYDFEFRGQRHTGTTGMSRQRYAEELERKERVRLERQAGDLSLRARMRRRVFRTGPRSSTPTNRAAGD